MKTILKETTINSLIRDLECSSCQMSYTSSALLALSPCCHLPLLACYGLDGPLSKSILINRANNMWRYREFLPIMNEENVISLGEGFTPILSLPNLANKYGLENLLLKDEGQNPTGSFKARGLSMAVSKAKELGVEGCIIPTAGNAGVALAAYCARAGMKAVVVMPRHTPKAFKEECYWYGAEVHLIDGLINDCALEANKLIIMAP